MLHYIITENYFSNKILCKQPKLYLLHELNFDLEYSYRFEFLDTK